MAIPNLFPKFVPELWSCGVAFSCGVRVKKASELMLQKRYGALKDRNGALNSGTGIGTTRTRFSSLNTPSEFLLDDICYHTARVVKIPSSMPNPQRQEPVLAKGLIVGLPCQAETTVLWTTIFIGLVIVQPRL